MSSGGHLAAVMHVTAGESNLFDAKPRRCCKISHFCIPRVIANGDRAAGRQMHSFVYNPLTLRWLCKPLPAPSYHFLSRGSLR